MANILMIFFHIEDLIKYYTIYISKYEYPGMIM